MKAALEGAARGPGGSVLLVEENRDLPLARVAVTLRCGAAEDPAGREGLVAFASELARRGAGGRGRAELDAAVEELGAELDVSPDFDSVTFDLEVLSRFVPQALALLADVVLRPDLVASEAEALRRETHASLDEMRDDDSSLARRFFTRELFGGAGNAHPYGHPLWGTDRSIDQLTVEDARRWLTRAVAGGNVVIGVAGDVDGAELRALVGRRFGALRTGGRPSELPAPPPFPSGTRLQIVDKPERTQSQILIGHPGPRWADDDYLPLLVGATAFGGTFTARLMNEVRSKRGLSYGASCRIGQARGARGVVVSVFPSLEQTPETLELVLDLWRDWVRGGVTDEEVRFAREYLAASFAFQVATPEDRLDLALASIVCGLPPDYRERAVERIEAVTPERVRAAMKRRLREEDLAITIVSTAKELQPMLAQRKLLPRSGARVVPFDSY